jgi:hypothetical protein
MSFPNRKYDALDGCCVWLVGRAGYNRGLMLKKIRRALSLGLLLFSGSLLIWAFLPSQRQVVTQTISSAEMQLPSSTQAITPTILETRKVVLEWPSSMRIGDMDEISLVFEPIQNEASSNNPQGEFSDVYNNYNIMAEARIEAAGIRANPGNPTRESMPSGHSVKFKWQVNIEQAGSYQGNVWLSLRFLPLDGRPASQWPIFVRMVDIHAVSLFGLSAPWARLLGGVGIILCVLIIFDDMIGLVRKWIGKTNLTIDSSQKERPSTQLNADERSSDETKADKELK